MIVSMPVNGMYIQPPCRIKSSVLLLSIRIVIMGWQKPVLVFWNKNIPNPFFLVAGFDNPHNICEYARSQNLPWGNLKRPAAE